MREPAAGMRACVLKAPQALQLPINKAAFLLAGLRQAVSSEFGKVKPRAAPFCGRAPPIIHVQTHHLTNWEE